MCKIYVTGAKAICNCLSHGINHQPRLRNHSSETAIITTMHHNDKICRSSWPRKKYTLSFTHELWHNRTSLFQSYAFITFPHSRNVAFFNVKNYITYKVTSVQENTQLKRKGSKAPPRPPWVRSHLQSSPLLSQHKSIDSISLHTGISHGGLSPCSWKIYFYGWKCPSLKLFLKQRYIPFITQSEYSKVACNNTLIQNYIA